MENNAIYIFLLALSFLFIIKNLLDVVIQFFQTTPKEIKLTMIEKFLIYASLSYIITYFLVV